jgi:PIN domain nuclease of toxin-antitoxin system
VILLDAYALVAFLANEPAADEVEKLLRTGDASVTVVNLAEAVDVLQRVHGITPDEVRQAVETLLGDTLAVVAQSTGDAWRAAELRTRYYDRTRRPLSLADCFLIAAVAADDQIASSDAPLAETAREEGLTVRALPDSTGARP